MLLASADARAEPREQKVDFNHTTVYFTVSHGGFTNVHGQFRRINLIESSSIWTTSKTAR